MTTQITAPNSIFHVSRSDREYFFKELPDWIDDNYQCVEYIKKPDVYEQFILPPDIAEQKERLELLEQIYELEESQIKSLKEQLSDFVEAVEAIHEFSSKVTDNTLEQRGLLKLIAETCGNLLKARQ